MDIYNLISLAGIFGLAFLAWAMSTNRRQTNWRLVVVGIAIQLAFGAIIFWTPKVEVAFLWINDAVNNLLAASQHGQEFVFGKLGSPASPVGFTLAFNALPMIIFFSALMGLLYYLRIMPLIIRAFAYVFTKLLRISGAESFCAASNIFVGIESTTAVRPYLDKMTRSEFCTILTAGMATVASSTMAIYVNCLTPVFPQIAGHLISASILSAPAAIIMSKLLVPEADQPETLGLHLNLHEQRDSGAIDAIVNGAMAGVKLIVGIVALLIAFLGIVALVDMILGWGSTTTGLSQITGGKLSLERIFGFIFSPLAILIGIPPADAASAGSLLGQRLVETEIPAYMALAQQTSKFAHPRTPVIIAYCLCGFAHFASMAIFVGGTAALVPNRRKDIVAVGPRALLAATMACLMTGAIAGVFFHERLTILAAGQ